MRHRTIALVASVGVVLAACGTFADAGAESATTTTVRTEATTTEQQTTTVPEPDTTAGDDVADTTTTSESSSDDSSSSTSAATQLTTTTATGAPAATVPSTTTTPPMLGEAPDSLMQPVIADAENRTGLDRSAMTVTRSEAVVWNDGSLGCPERGVMYTQEIIDGYWIELSAGDVMLDYRLNSNGAFILCENGGLRP